MGDQSINLSVGRIRCARRCLPKVTLAVDLDRVGFDEIPSYRAGEQATEGRQIASDRGIRGPAPLSSRHIVGQLCLVDLVDMKLPEGGLKLSERHPVSSLGAGLQRWEVFGDEPLGRLLKSPALSPTAIQPATFLHGVSEELLCSRLRCGASGLADFPPCICESNPVATAAFVDARQIVLRSCESVSFSWNAEASTKSLPQPSRRLSSTHDGATVPAAVAVPPKALPERFVPRLLGRRRTGHRSLTRPKTSGLSHSLRSSPNRPQRHPRGLADPFLGQTSPKSSESTTHKTFHKSLRENLHIIVCDLPNIVDE